MTDAVREGDAPSVVRRALLRAVAGAGALSLAGIGTGAGTTAGRDGESLPGGRLDDATDPHTWATFRAVADAGVPETVGLADRRGAEHEPGALAVDLEELMVWGLNNFLRLNPTSEGATETEARLPEAVASLLDAAALALLARGDNEHRPDVLEASTGGPFARLAPRDRFRAIHLIETREVDSDRLPVEFREFHGDLSHVVAAIQALVVAGYYSEWSGYANGTDSPDDWRFEGDVQSYDQTDYPGPSRGYAALRGYELRQFRENDWRDGKHHDGAGRDAERQSGGGRVRDPRVDPIVPDPEGGEY